MRRLWIISIFTVVLLVLAACGEDTTGVNVNTDSGGNDISSDATGEQSVKDDLVLGAGALGGTYYTIGAAVGDLLSSKVDSISRVSVLSGANNSFLPPIQEAKIDLAFATPDMMYYAYSEEAGQGYDEGQTFDKIRFMGAFAINIMDIVVLADSDIQSIGDIGNGGVGVIDSSLAPPMKIYLESHGIENPKVVVIPDWNQLGQSLRNGSIVAIQAISSHPLPFMTELSNSVDVRLIEGDKVAVEKFLTNDATRFFQKVVQAAGTYDFQTEDYNTVGRGSTVIVSADIDDEQVYEMTKAIYEGVDILTKIHPQAASFTTDILKEYFDAGVIQIPIHPGAKRYFEEQGITIPASVPEAN